MIGALILGAATLPIATSELVQQPVTVIAIPRMVFMCVSDDGLVRPIIDARHDSTADYLKIYLHEKRAETELSGPVAIAADKKLPDSYVLAVSTGQRPDGAKLAVQIQLKDGRISGAWFDWNAKNRITGTCERVPFPEDRKL